MNEKKKDLQAFPHEFKYGDGTAERTDGMSLRDYFAAKAMTSFAIPMMYNIITNSTSEGDALVSKRAYELADSMMKAREA